MSRKLLDADWKFHEGDIAPENEFWGLLKAASYNQSADAIDFDDSDWATVHLPHDFVIGHPVTPPAAHRDPAVPCMEYISDMHVTRGSRTGGIAWYRKKLRIGKCEKRIWLRFDGIYRNSELYVNQFLVYRHRSGYTGFSCDITDFLREDSDNIIAVRVDARHSEGWFYEGGGIYRHVWMIEKRDCSFAPDGIFVSAVPDLNAHTAMLHIRAEIRNVLESTVSDRLTCTVYGPDQLLCTQRSENFIAEPFTDTTVQLEITLSDAQFWELDSPLLYRLECTLASGDTESVSFGIRDIKFTADHGFFLNGKRTKLRGVCCHEDHAGLGMARPDGILEYRVRKLKEMGANAYRCAHNPVSEELLSVCDRLGILVMAEQRMMSAARDELEQMEALVRLARNHPSVILYSIGNEEAHIQFTEWGRKNAVTLKKLCHHLDPTRKVTAAVCMWEAGGHFQKVSDPKKQGMLLPGVDVFGFNYFPEIWDAFHRAYPDTPLIVTEDSSFTGTRGCHQTDAPRCHYDMMEKKDGWPYRKGEEEWINAAEREYLAGAFIWTGFDYYGEPSPYSYPAVSSQFGIMDLCGFPKDMYYYYKAWWQTEPVLHLCQNATEIWCMTNADEVALFADDRSLGIYTIEKNRLLVIGNSGMYRRLRAIGYKDKKQILETNWIADVVPDHIGYTVFSYKETDGSRTVILDLTVMDGAGRIAEGCFDPIRLEYPAEGMKLLATGNGDPSDHDPVTLSEKHAFAGQLQAIFSLTRESAEIIVHADGLPAVPISL